MFNFVKENIEFNNFIEIKQRHNRIHIQTERGNHGSKHYTSPTYGNSAL